MHSSLIGKIEKAKRYAEEPDRVRFDEFSATFRGEHDDYTVTYRGENWHCTCDFFAGWGVCSHTMTIHHLIGHMMSHEAIPAPAAPPVSVAS